MKTRRAGCLFNLVKLLALIAITTVVVLYFVITYSVPFAVRSAGKIVGVDMDLESFSFNVIDQSVEMEEFYINNPEGFKKDTKALAFDKVRLDVDSAVSNYLKKDLVVVDEFVVEGYELSFEALSVMDLINNNNNLVVILNKFKSEQEEEEADGDTEIKVILKKAVFKGGKINGTVSGLSLNLALPDFSLENIGAKEGGVTTVELSIIILDALISQSVELLSKKASLSIGNVGDVIGETLGGATKSIFDGF